MDFSIPRKTLEELERYRIFLKENLTSRLAAWNKEKRIPRDFFRQMGKQGWLGYHLEGGKLVSEPSLKRVLFYEELAKISPGVAVAVLVQDSLGMKGLSLFGGDRLIRLYGQDAIDGEVLVALGNTENQAGSDVANIGTTAERAEGGWRLSGAKAFVTNGVLCDYLLVTAITDPEEERSRRLSLFWVDMQSEGVSRRVLNKDVWIPSDLTRVQLKDVFVPDNCLMGQRGYGMGHILEIFTHSRLTISGMTLGTAAGAFDMGLARARKRRAFGKKLLDFQAKSFEIADLYARLEASRLMLYRACWEKDRGEADFRMGASMAKYLAVEVARQVSAWAADIFGAVSVVADHPVHKFPMDAWASSLGEGTQDIQKLIIFRELMKKIDPEDAGTE